MYSRGLISSSLKIKSFKISRPSLTIFSDFIEISLDILKEYKQEKFSFNIVWDELIDKKLIFGDVMKSDWYHVGDKNGLNEAENSMT